MPDQNGRKPKAPKITVTEPTESERSARILRGFAGMGTLDERILKALCAELPENNASGSGRSIGQVQKASNLQETTYKN